MAAGSAEAHDANPRRHAPLGTLLRARLPAPGPPVASPPPRSRCDNQVSRPARSRMARGLGEHFIPASARPPQRIVLDVDAPEAPGQGAPAQARYAGDAGGSGGLPLPLSAGLAGRRLTTLFTANRCTGPPRRSVVTRLGKRLRHAWPDTRWSWRGDRHCASPEGRPWSAAQAPRRSVTGWTSHAVVQPRARAVGEPANRASAREGGTSTRCHATRSQAGTWAHSRRVVRKVAGSDPGVQTRCVVPAMAEARTPGLSQGKRI
jgi:hypothetical protein